MAETPTNSNRIDDLGLEMPFGEHLEELRRRLIFALVGIVPLFIIALAVGEPVVKLLIEPLLEAQASNGNSTQMQVTGLFEYFTAYCKVAIVLTLIVGLPWVFYQAWKFIAPGLYQHEKRFAYTLIPMSVALSIIGVVFMYLVMLPVVMAFFILFNGGPSRSSPLIDRPKDAPAPIVIPMYPGDLKDPRPGEIWVNTALHQLRIATPDGAGGDKKDAPLIIWSTSLTHGDQLFRQEFRVSEYIETVFDFALAFAIAFQAPVAVLLLGWIGIINPALMSKYRRHAIMACTVIGAVLTPADPISIFLLAIPLYVLYELGLALLRWLPAKRVARGLRAPLDEGEPHDPEASGP